MNRGIRITAAAAVALAVALGVSGCTEATSIYSDVVITSELDGLQRDLEPLGADVSYTSEMGADYHYTVRIEVQLGDTDRDTLESVITKSIEKLRGDVFLQQGVSLDLKSGEDPVFSASNPGALDALDDDLDYWFDLRDAAGVPLAMNINTGPEYDGYTLSFASSETPDFDALRAVGNGDYINTGWTFPGIDAYGSLPPAEVTDLLGELSAVLPPLDYIDPGVNVQWNDGRASVTVLAVDLVGAESLADSATWPSVVEIARLSADRTSSLFFYGDGTGDADSVYVTVHFGVCEKQPKALSVEEDFFALLAASVALPAGSGPGLCQDPI